MDGTTEIKCVRCYQPDVPFVWYFVFNEYAMAYQIRHDPYGELNVEYITIAEANERIEKFQKSMLGIK